MGRILKIVALTSKDGIRYRYFIIFFRNRKGAAGENSFGKNSKKEVDKISTLY